MLYGTVTIHGRTAKWAFSSRHGGVSPAPYDGYNMAGHVGDDVAHVRENRRRLEQWFHCGPLSWMGPVHGVDVTLLTQASAISPNVDALATRAGRTPLATLGADCVPMLLVAEDLVVAAHVGWRGLVDGMTTQVASLLDREGIASQDAHVLLGPSICGHCYGIADERAALITAACAPAMVTAHNGGPGADIRAGLSSEWTALGARVQLVGGCTYESPEYFSHRRSGVTGRQAGVIAWTT